MAIIDTALPSTIRTNFSVARAAAKLPDDDPGHVLVLANERAVGLLPEPQL
ncbi:hypothetical protein [Brevibacterium yomogidense]|uniref:hypothetical protein n=1 Tax=Brevibacterium yomogidense TaxID=946573 RepID=UPI0018DF0B40|nr:hypothetical protein [Brevibacterium yomogidense]